MNIQRNNLIRYGTWILVVVAVLLSLILLLLLRGDGRLEAGFGLPRVTPTAQVTPTPTPALLSVTAAPTPISVRVRQNYPPEAVDLVADGKLLFTMESVQSAQQALERYLTENAAGALLPNERLIRAGFDQRLTLEEPTGTGMLLNVDEAVGTLKVDETLLPIYRTVVRCQIDRGERETVLRENPQLAKGSRLYRAMGVYPYTLSYYETSYRGQAAFSEVKTNEFAVGPGRADQIIENGTCVMGEAGADAGPEKRKIEGFTPNWPVAGTVEASFGMVDGVMHYSVDISADPVARVMAPAEGVITYCAQRGEMGLVIDILHDETGAMSRIIGCKSALVELYQRVKKGEQVGVLPEPAGGKTVLLRYELLLDGLPVNPEKYLPER